MNKVEFLIETFGLKRAGLGWLSGVDRSAITNYLNNEKPLSKNSKYKLKVFLNTNDKLFDDNADSDFLSVVIYLTNKDGSLEIQKNVISLNDLIEYSKNPKALVIFTYIDNISEIKSRLKIDIFIVDDKINKELAHIFIIDSYFSLLFIERNRYYFNKEFNKNDYILSEGKENNLIAFKLTYLVEREQFFKSIFCK